MQDCSILTEVRALLGSLLIQQKNKGKVIHADEILEYTLFSKPMLLPPNYMKEKRMNCNATILTVGKGEV